MSRKKRVAWKPLKLVYDQLRKTVKEQVDKDEFDRICKEIGHHQSVVHLLLSRMYVDIEIINDDLKHLQARNEDCTTAMNNALKWLNTSVDIVDAGIEDEHKEDFSQDYTAFNNAIDWFFGPRAVEICDAKMLDIKYRSRFRGRKPYETINEHRAYEVGYCDGSIDECAEKNTIEIVDKDGSKMYVEQGELVKWFENYCNDKGIPRELVYYTEKRQINE